MKAGLLLCLKTGIAAGELCALKWEDIHLDSRIVIINKRIQRIVDTDSGTEKRAKTKIIVLPAEERKVPIPKDLVEYLRVLPHLEANTRISFV